jgi:hypothetical protein
MVCQPKHLIPLLYWFVQQLVCMQRPSKTVYHYLIYSYFRAQSIELYKRTL